GFGVLKLRSNNYTKDFGPTRIDLACTRNKVQPSEAHLRQTSTKKADCTFRATAKALSINQRRWTLIIDDPVHNHEAAPDN
ncbi:hypothetical protein B0T24DRAFT_503486, partial [Lasiosphaeria ovina]